MGRVWAFAPENEESESKKPKPEIESLEGKMSVAPDGKSEKPKEEVPSDGETKE